MLPESSNSSYDVLEKYFFNYLDFKVLKCLLKQIIALKNDFLLPNHLNKSLK